MNPAPDRDAPVEEHKAHAEAFLDDPAHLEPTVNGPEYEDRIDPVEED